MAKTFLVLGGAGYIGSAVVSSLCDSGNKVLVIDNLQTGKKNFVDPRAEFFQVDVLDRKNFFDFFRNSNNYFDAIFHFAANKDARESQQNASKFSKDITGIQNVLDAMVKFKIPKIIFSSSAAVYGNPSKFPISESAELKPTNFYGASKKICEELIFWYHQIHHISFIIFRYFNVAGDIGLKFFDTVSSNLFPEIVRVLRGEKDYLQIFGQNFKTRDGTAIRDYIHLQDLVQAHILAIDFSVSEIFNLGTKNGSTVLEILETFEKIFGKKIPKKFLPRKTGEPEKLIADSFKAQKFLNWQPKNSLENIVFSVWNYVFSGKLTKKIKR